MPFSEDANDSTVARIVVDRFYNVANILPGPKEAKWFGKLEMMVNI